MNNPAVLLIGHGSREGAAIEQYKAFAQQVAARLDTAVEPCFLEFADPPIAEGIATCVGRGADRIVALPLFLGPAGHQKNDVPAVINWARRQWPHVAFDYGTPLGAQYHVVAVLAARAAEAMAGSEVAAEETAVLVVSRGSRDPDANSEVAKLARLLFEGRPFGLVEAAYYALTEPRVEAMIGRMAALGFRRVVAVPHLLFTGRIHQKIVAQGQAAAARYGVEVVTADCLFPHPALVEAVAERYGEVVGETAAMTCDLCKYRRSMAGFEEEFQLPQTSDPSHGFRGVAVGHDYEKRMSEALPPQERNGRRVSPAPMAAADLVYNADGAVAWGEIWEEFCDLALAGGPTHRETLLEAPLAAEVAADRAAYEAVRDEIERGLRQVTNLEVVRETADGWIGLRCHSEEMAIWLMRAIIVENVMVRRQGETLFLPAGPSFELAAEIKNVVTVVAKTFHYWMEHAARR